MAHFHFPKEKKTIEASNLNEARELLAKKDKPKVVKPTLIKKDK